MFNVLSYAAACIASTGLLSSALFGIQDFEVVNATGYEIYEMYVSPSDVRSWEEDVLGQYTLPNGSSMDVTFDDGEDACMWDIMVVYEIDNEHVYWDDINLCEVSTVELRYDANTGRTWAITD